MAVLAVVALVGSAAGPASGLEGIDRMRAEVRAAAERHAMRMITMGARLQW